MSDFLTVASGLSAKYRYEKRMEEIERARRDGSFENPLTSGRVHMGHERYIQTQKPNL